ncbi:MAG: TVP38/TMEM64 family protein [bacterium]|nr:TVP38/TMEM64 family protein [bacterium]
MGRLQIAGIVGLVLGSVMLAIATLELGPTEILARLETTFHLLEQSPPLIFFGVMALVCVFPIPISLFYMTAAPLFGTVPSLAWIAVAIVFNMVIAHLAARGLLRPGIERLLACRGFTLPRMNDSRDERLVIVLIRITPGIPFFAQNLLLGLADVHLLSSLAISLPIQMVFATGFVVLGRSAFDGDLGLAVLAIGLLGAASIGARFVHRHIRSHVERGPAKASEIPSTEALHDDGAIEAKGGIGIAPESGNNST